MHCWGKKENMCCTGMQSAILMSFLSLPVELSFGRVRCTEGRKFLVEKVSGHLSRGECSFN
jgi:hypothetical protein